MARALVTALVFSAALASQSASATVDASTEAHLRQLMEERTAEARRLFEASGFESVGTAANEIHVPIHRCHVLATIFGKTHLLDQLVPEPIDAVSPTYSMSVMSNSLNNWAFMAGRMLEVSETERVRTWNLDCVGEFGIAAAERIGEADRAAFVAIEGNRIRVLGDVVPGFFDELKAAIDAHPETTVVALGSAGGHVLEALKAGRYIREEGLSTTLYNACESACALVYLGGYQRSIWSPYPQLGFHKVGAHGESVPNDHEIYDIIAQYAQDMDIDPDFVLWTMQSAELSEMAYPELDELCEANAATWVQRVCQGPGNERTGPGRTPSRAPTEAEEIADAAARNVIDTVDPETATQAQKCAYYAAELRLLARKTHPLMASFAQAGLIFPREQLIDTYQRESLTAGC